jgi:hypothetical protein
MEESPPIIPAANTAKLVPSSGDLRRAFFSGIACYSLTSTVVILGVLVGQTLLKPGQHRRPERQDMVTAFAAWDGNWYGLIASGGYKYNPNGPSRVNFFPVYPMLGTLLARLTGLDPVLALLLISQLSLAAAFSLAAAYLRPRFPEAPAASTDYVLLSMGLFPPTLFFRMAYTESFFLLLIVLVLYGMERKGSLLGLTLLIGLATGTRLAGLALLVPFVVHVWHRSLSLGSLITRMALLMPLACWGVLAFMFYTWFAFGKPLAFVEAVGWWRHRPPVPWEEKLIDLATLEPIWSLFDPASPIYWGRREDAGLGPLCYGLMDPLFFVLVAVLVLVGTLNRWLTTYEILLAVALLLIAYIGRGHEVGMAASGRYAAVVFPAYLTLGRLLICFRPLVVMSILAVCAFLLGMYSAMFTAWYPVL